MGVFKRYRDAQAAQKDAENAMPGAYQSNYTDRINETLDSMGAASNAGYDVGTDSELYRQYRAGAQANARTAAENAAAGAAALSGGYGSSYAGSVAQQGYQQAMAKVDDGLAGLRDKALTMYQLKQNGLSGLLSALQNQDSLEAAEHQGAVANAQDWRDYKKSRADQAAQEKSDFLSNLWEMAKNVGKAGLTAYDTYKGYTQQQWENEFAREQWDAQQKRTAISDATNYKGTMSEDFINGLLAPYGLDSSIFSEGNTNNATLSPADYLTAMKGITGLYNDGFHDAAGAVADMYGISRDTLNYTPQYTTGSYSGRRSSGSGGSSGSRSSGTKSSGSSPTYAQLLSMSKEFVDMKASDPRYDYYKRTLTNAGWIKDDTPNLLETNRSLTGQSWAGDPANKWGAGVNSGKQNVSDDVLNRVAGYAQRGMNGSAITVKLQHEGYSNEEIAEIFNRAGL